ncbi:MAG TPA: fimbria/pilus outer membrane usher protein [Candidatus Rubrimentiphilum sp.]|nr:fimbria/pilus outer membrane usher protein [Candidatus Rubrimentiphilum sp.]
MTLHVNTLDQGETVAILRDKDVLVPIDALEQGGIHGLGGKRETIRGQVFVSLASLAPAVVYNLNEDSLSLDVTVQPKFLPSIQLDLVRARPANVEYTGSRSAYVNYSASRTSAGDANAFLETGINRGSHVLYDSFNFATGASAHRGLTYFENDDRLRSVRQVYGDFVESTGDLGGSTFIGGIASARAFDLDPYAIHYPLPGFSGAVTSPSTADIYVNGVLTSRIDLSPGNFDLTRLPVASGSATTQVVVTDAFGHTQTYTQSSYISSDLLIRGTSDFEYAAGLVRNNAFQDGDRYGPGAVMGHYRLGVSNLFTAGGRFEASSGLVSFGPVFDLRLKPGLLHLALGASHAAGLTGGALSLGYSYAAPRFGGGVTLLTQSSSYANISQSPSADRATSAITGFLTAQLGRQSVGLQIFRRGDRDGGASSQIALTASSTIAKTFSLAVTVERDTNSTSGPHSSVVAMLTRPFGRLGASLTEKIDPLNGSTNLQVQASPKNLFGLGYIASVDSAHTINGSFLYRSQYGDAGIDYSKGRGSVFTDTLRLSGGLALIGHGIYPTRAVTGSFALVDIPDTPGVHIYLENQDVGKTNKHGKILVTGLLPNYGNSIRLEDADAPLNTSLQTEQKLIAPPPKGGAVVTFPAVRLQALVGTLQVLDNGKVVIPADGEVLVSGNGFDTRSDIGTGGEFYLENIPPGKYKALIRYAQGECTFDLVAPSSTQMLLNLGTLQCRK